MNNYTKLRNLLIGVNGATFIGLDTLTNVVLKGGWSNPWNGHIQKRVTGSNVMVFQNKKINGYENMVQNRLIEEGKDPTLFVLQRRSWGVRVPETPFIEHKGFHYLEVIFLRPGKIEYLYKEKIISKYSIPGFIHESEESEQGGLDRKVIIRTYRCDSITGITINKNYTSFTKGK